jgi:hypothetical protein
VPGAAGVWLDLRLEQRRFLGGQRDAQAYRPQFERLDYRRRNVAGGPRIAFTAA